MIFYIIISLIIYTNFKKIHNFLQEASIISNNDFVFWTN